MIELRGIIIDAPKGAKRIQLVVRGSRGDDYTTLEYPKGAKLTRGAIEKFLAREMGIGVKEVAIAPHVRIPEGK